MGEEERGGGRERGRKKEGEEERGGGRERSRQLRERGRQLQWRGGRGEAVTVVERRRGRQLPQPHLSLAVQAISCSGKWLVKPMALITE